MKSAHPARIFGFAAAGAGLAAIGAHAQGQKTIIQDIFTSGSQYGVPLGAQGANAAGVVPSPTDLPGGPWQHITGAFYDSKEYNGNMNGVNGRGDSGSSDLAGFHNGGASGIALGAYNTGSLHVSAGESFLMQGKDALPEKGPYIMAGFSSKLNSASNYGPPALSTFTGLVVLGSGALQDYVNGAPVGSPIAFAGSYSAYTETVLSYTIDTTTGAISDVSFGASRANYTFPVPKSFSKAYTANVAIGGNASVGGSLAAISSFILSAPGATEAAEGK